MLKKLLIAALALLMLCSCSVKKAESKSTAKELTAGIVSDGVAGTDVSALVGSGDFAFSSFSLASQDSDNPIYSPLSAFFALAMAAQGAGGDTLEQFTELLGMTSSEMAAYCNQLTTLLSDTAGDTKLSLANSAWTDKDAVIYEEYLKTLVGNFDAELFSADLDTSATRKDINNWVSDKTNKLIKELLSENLDPSTVLVLINAIYMDAKWSSPFKAESTTKMDFFPESGKAVKADFMRKFRVPMKYISGDDFEGTILPYNDGKTVFTVLRPTNGQSVRDLASALSSETLFDSIENAQANTLINLALPKLDTASSYEMNDLLQALGLVDAFSPANADLSGIGSLENGNLYISRVIQKARIIIDEEGTKAAAVTAVMKDNAAAPPTEEPIDLIFDSPYFYTITDSETQTVLFMGIVDQP